MKKRKKEKAGGCSLQFLGAAGTVTGSKFLVDNGRNRVMVDCGMFQGAKRLRLMNWEAPPVPPNSVDHIVLTHAHVDHIGMLPLFVKQGFQGPVWCTPATLELCGISLIDAAHLQEEDARFANKMGFSKHSPALPLYTQDDAKRALDLLRPIEYDTDLELNGDCRVRLRDAGHILGSSFVEMDLQTDGRQRRLVFSGDLGRYKALILRDPGCVEGADYLVVESTYGNRTHPPEAAFDEVRDCILETARRGGVLVVPAFALGRTQTLLYVLRELKERSLIPDLPVFVDSPMAVEVTELFCRHIDAFDEEARAVYQKTGKCPLYLPKLNFVRTPSESKELNSMNFPSIIISASGMATGGRILHHLKHRLPESRNTVLFIGYQADGTRGQLLQSGAREVKIHGEMVPVRAAVRTMESFSGHADKNEILRWLSSVKTPPARTFVVHGEPDSSKALAEDIKSRLHWQTHVPEYLETVRLN